MITADSITDEQIRELRSNTGWLGLARDDQKMLGMALRGDERARALCAEIVNARALHCRGFLCADGNCECDCTACLQHNEFIRGYRARCAEILK